MLPRLEKCDCGEQFNINHVTPCPKCRSNYCEKCNPKGAMCIYCSPKTKENKIMDRIEKIMKNSCKCVKEDLWKLRQDINEDNF